MALHNELPIYKDAYALINLSLDLKQYATAIEITESIGRQASGWKKSSKASPAT